MTGDDARLADAAFFEDWSEWLSLDGKPPAPRAAPHSLAPANGDWCRYYLVPDMAARAFDLHTPAAAPVKALIKRVPGAVERPAGNWRVPAASWQALRAVLPEIKRLIMEREARLSAEATAYEAKAKGAAAKRIAEAVTGDRTVAGMIEAIGNAMVLDRNSLTPWERDFMGPILDRLGRYGDKLRLSEKQSAVVGRIHDKIKHRVVI